MKIFICILILMFVLSHAAASEIDKLMNNLNTLKQSERNTSKEVDILNNLANCYIGTSQEMNFNYSSQAAELSKKIEYSTGLALSYRNMGLGYYYEKKYPEALESLDISLKLYRQADDRESIAGNLGNLGIIHYSLEEYDTAIASLTEALQINEEIGNKKGSANSLNNLGNIYYDLNKLETALEYYKQSAQFHKDLKNISGEIAVLSNIALIFGDTGRFEEALDTYKDVLGKQEEITNEEGIQATLGNIGNIYNSIGNYKSALEYYDSALKIYKKNNDKEGIATTLGNIGIVQAGLGNFDIALEKYLSALKIKEESENKVNIAGILNNIALIYIKTDNHEKALIVYENTLKSLPQNIEETAAILGNMGIIYKKLSNLQKSLEYYQRSLKIYTEINNKTGIANSKNNIGLIYEETSSYENALNYCNEALEVYKEIGNKTGIASCLNDIGNIYLNKNDLVNAGKYLEDSIQTALEINSKEQLISSYDSYILLLEKQTKFKNALLYFKKFTAIKDSVFSEKGNNKIAELQTKYETEKKEKENESYKLELEKQKLTKWRLIFGLGVVLTFASLFYYGFRLKSEANKKLERRIHSALKKQKEQQEIIIHQAGLTSLGELAAGISHEINQPLQNINFTTENLFLENTEDLLSGDILKNNLKEILEDIGRIRKIIDHVRDFSRIQKDETAEVFNVNDSVNNALSMTKKMYSKAQINTKLSLQSNISEITGNPYKFEQVILNLLSNAKDAVEHNSAEKDKHIILSTHEHNSKIIISVKDNGMGISEQDYAKIFLPFYTKKKPGKGTGLGLSISYGIIKEMGGFISVNSVPGTGTEFNITIPKDS
jgi:two-component system, NtrC family, sensor kinase